MNEVYLLDTNAISETIKPDPNQLFMSRFHAHYHEVATAAPALCEILYGCLRLPPSRRRSRLEHYVENILRPRMPILPYDAVAAEWHANERVRLAKGQTPPFVDGQIDAIAATHGPILVTANVKDFENFVGLTVVDWSR